jgi:hypothetical protein
MFHWIDVLVHKTCTSLINLFELEGEFGLVIRVSLAAMWLASIITVIHGIKFVATDLHVRFWLSGWPLCTLVGDAVMLFFLVLVAVTMELLTVSRHKQKNPSAVHVTCVEPLMHCCRVLHKDLQHHVLQRLCMGFFMFSIAVTIFGANTTVKGTYIGETLLHKCGHSHNAASRELEATWKELDAFYAQCDPLRKMPIRQCPGFATLFPSPAPMVRYLEVLETKKGCSGFCKFAAKPIFTAGQGAGGRSMFPTRCASLLGEDMRRVSLWVGVPSTALGLSIAMMSFCLFSFDNL